MKKMHSELPVAAPVRLLLIEDDVRLCRLVKDYLENMGYAVSMEHTGPAGLALGLREQFQAIILDVDGRSGHGHTIGISDRTAQGRLSPMTRVNYRAGSRTGTSRESSRC